MGAAAELQRGRPRLHDPHRRAVLVAEERDGAHLLGLVARGLGRLDPHVGQHGVVGQREDLVELLAGGLAVVREVEAQVVGRDQRALLAHVVAQHRAQRGVQQVGRGVVAPDGLPALAVDGGQRVLPRLHLAVTRALCAISPGTA